VDLLLELLDACACFSTHPKNQKIDQDIFKLPEMN